MAKVADIFDDVTKEGHKIPKEHYLPSGLFPIIDQGQEYIAGYSNDGSRLYRKVPAIIFGDHTRIIKYVDTPCYLGADGVKLLRAKIPNANYKFLYYALCNARIPDTGYNRHFKWLKEIEIPIISVSEQQYVVSVLDKVNNLISIRKQQLTKLDELVKARFIEIFGDPIRESGYVRKPIAQLGAVGTGNTPLMSISEYYDSKDIPFVKPGDIVENAVAIVENESFYISENARKVARIVPKGSVLVTCIGTIGKVGVTAHESACNQQINYIVPKDSINTIYLAHCLSLYKPVFIEIANSPVVPIINKSQFSSVAIPMPPIDLQKKFAVFVEQVDKTKLTVQQGLDKLELLKKALMQKYFG